MFDDEHANQGAQCSSVPTYTLVVHNVALNQLGGAQDNFACSLSFFFHGVQCNVVSLSVCLSVSTLTIELFDIRSKFMVASSKKKCNFQAFVYREFNYYGL